MKNLDMKEGGFLLNWPRRIFAKTGLGRPKIGSSLRPSEEEDSEWPKVWLRRELL